jgi:ketosteroid isomerase-like protein
MADLTQTVKDLYAAFGRGDIAAILAMLADDVVWELEGPAILPFAGIRRGKTEAASFFEGLAAGQSGQKLTITDYVASGDTVMTLGRYSAKVDATGKTYDSPVAHYWKFRDGKVIRQVGLANTAAAAEAFQPASAAAAR